MLSSWFPSHLTFGCRAHCLDRILQPSHQFFRACHGCDAGSASVEKNETLRGSSGSSDPTAGLSFNLRLTAKQRAARDAVPLPYSIHGTLCTMHMRRVTDSLACS